MARFIGVEHSHAIPSFVEHSIPSDYICVLKSLGRRSIKQILTTHTTSTSPQQVQDGGIKIKEFNHYRASCTYI